jgi:hypothetical protein
MTETLETSKFGELARRVRNVTGQMNAQRSFWDIMGRNLDYQTVIDGEDIHVTDSRTKDSEGADTPIVHITPQYSPAGSQSLSLKIDEGRAEEFALVRDEIVKYAQEQGLNLLSHYWVERKRSQTSRVNLELVPNG